MLSTICCCCLATKKLTNGGGVGYVVDVDSIIQPSVNNKLGRLTSNEMQEYIYKIDMYCYEINNKLFYGILKIVICYTIIAFYAVKTPGAYNLIYSTLKLKCFIAKRKNRLSIFIRY